MSETIYQKTFRLREAVLAQSSSTTLCFDRLNGTRIRQHLPFADKSLRESAVGAFSEARSAQQPEPREIAQILVVHPCCEQMLNVAAKIVLRGYPKDAAWIPDLIPHAQGTAWLSLVEKPKVFAKALATPDGRFTGWGFEFLFHRCQESARELSGEALWPKSLKPDQLSVIVCEPIARGTDVVAVVIGHELCLIIEKYDSRTRMVIDYELEGLNENEIAEKIGMSRHQFYHFRQKIRVRFERDLKNGRDAA
jgi:hypothetical protein